MPFRITPDFGMLNRRISRSNQCKARQQDRGIAERRQDGVMVVIEIAKGEKV